MPSTRVIKSPRASREGTLRLGTSAVLLDPESGGVLLTRRADNGMWCLPGGRVDPGESIAESVEREFFEETGIRVRVQRLTGVYSNPDLLVIYPDGTKSHIVVMNFLVERISGDLILSPETTEIRFIPLEEALKMDLFHNHAEHLHDALAGQNHPYIK